MDAVDSYMSQWQRQRPDLDHRPMGIVARLTRAGGLLGSSIRENLRGTGLEPWEFDVLAALRRVGPPHVLSPKELAAITMVGNAAMTHRVDKLMERGLVSRNADPKSRRSLQISLTEEGLALIDAVVAAHSNNAGHFLEALSESERQTLSGLLHKVLVSHGDAHS